MQALGKEDADDIVEVFEADWSSLRSQLSKAEKKANAPLFSFSQDCCMAGGNWPKRRKSERKVTGETSARHIDAIHPVLELLNPIVPNAVLGFSTDHVFSIVCWRTVPLLENSLRLTISALYLAFD